MVEAGESNHNIMSFYFTEQLMDFKDPVCFVIEIITVCIPHLQ
jgi:hypothetical protein